MLKAENHRDFVKLQVTLRQLYLKIFWYKGLTTFAWHFSLIGHAWHVRCNVKEKNSCSTVQVFCDNGCSYANFTTHGGRWASKGGQQNIVYCLVKTTNVESNS